MPNANPSASSHEGELFGHKLLDYERSLKLWLSDIEDVANPDRIDAVAVYADARLDGSTTQVLDLALEVGLGVWP